MNKWLYHLIFSGLYPAILGTFVIAALGGTVAKDISPVWVVILLVYFSVQHAEGMVGGEGRNPWRYWGDAAEMVVMAACFTKLYPKELPLWMDALASVCFAALAAIAFAVPPVTRMLSDWDSLLKPPAGPTPDHSGFYLSLTGLSLAAVAACVVFALVPRLEGAMIFVVAAALVIYLAFFVFFNKWLTRGRFCRPET